jgi:hypothetical protein
VLPAAQGELTSNTPAAACLLQATRNGGMVLFYGAMAAFDFKCGIPDLLFRHATLY